MGFRGKVILTFLPLSIGILIFFASLLYVLEKGIVENQTNKFVEQITEARGEEIGTWINELIVKNGILLMIDHFG